MKETKNLENNKETYDGREAAEAMARNTMTNELILRMQGTVNVDRSQNFASVFSKRGEKGVNQDCGIVWEEFGCQEDMMFCGIFDGHGPWGHFVAKRTYADIDRDLEQHCKIDSFNSGTTASTIVRQSVLFCFVIPLVLLLCYSATFGKEVSHFIFIANVGDSSAALATMSETGDLEPVQLTIDFKPNLPRVHRVWLPDKESPGLAMSRAFGDYCVEDFGLVSVPEVTRRHIMSEDQFVMLATDWVWDVISNEKAVEIVSSTVDRVNSANCLVKWAVHSWKKKRKEIAMDDISAIVLFFM
ncbi:unnamed protein product [Fraxinus pennsylvanica]|uniref:PPM-type phosphatase domain-containing protein n=1 Tax=Fraxinus pennsylvanica TaxID=56036 RepID=A0AAD2DSK9_9LAMI|nr:unnamed protein product [Fraxinus pennsylvanica]